MGPNPEDLARAQDPTTSASELSSLAAVDPALWPAIAVHPNVYPDLLEWMHENGLDANAEAPTSTPMTPQARAAEASVALPISVTVMAWIKQRSRLLIWIGGGVVTAILAVVLVMTLVVAPQQRAAEAAAAAAAALKEAIAGFDDSATRCERMNAGLESAITVAEGQAAIDPGTLADPSLISSLRDEIDIAAGTERCDVPSMASDLADIDAQVVQVEADADGVEDATRKLEDAGSQVQRSVAEKEQVAAAAAAEAQRVAEAAQVAARTWTMQDPQGYSFTGTLAIGSITTSLRQRDADAEPSEEVAGSENSIRPGIAKLSAVIDKVPRPVKVTALVGAVAIILTGIASVGLTLAAEQRLATAQSDYAEQQADAAAGDVQNLEPDPTSTPEPAPPAVPSAFAAQNPAAFQALGLEGVEFDSPSGNIHCGIYSTGGVDDYFGCAIDEYTWEDPTPTGKALECSQMIHYGGGFIVRAEGPTEVLCRGGVMFGGEYETVAVLPYGTSVTHGGAVCESAETGVTCRSLVTGAGFQLSKSKFSMF